MADIAEDPAAGQPAPTGQPPALEPEAADQRAAPEAEEADAGAAEAAGPPEGAGGEEGAQTGAGAADESGNGSAAAPSQQEEEQNSAAAGDAPVAEAEGLAGETAALHLGKSKGAAASAESEPEEAAGIAADQAATCGEQEAEQSLTEGGAEVAAEDEGKEGEEEQQQEEQAPSPAPAAASSHLSRSTRSTRSTKAKLTFTGPPKCLERRPRTAMRSNFSHSQQRVRQILRDNEALVRRLGDIAYQQPEHERSQQKHDWFMANVAATAAARRRVEARRIMQQNLRIYQRLQEVKPSRDVARACHDKDFAKHEKMLAALAALRRKNGGSGGWVK